MTTKIISITSIFTFLLIINFSCSNKNKSDKSISYAVPKDTSIIGLISDSIIHSPKNPELYADRAKIYFTQKELNLALRDMEKAISLDSLNVDYYNIISDNWILKGNSKPAKEYLDKAYKINPENTGTLIRLAKLYLYIDHYEKCFYYVNEAIKINPALSIPYFVKGLCYDQMGDSIKAIKEYQTAVERNPDFYEAYILLGLKYAQMKDTLAILYNRNAIRLKPKSIEAHYNQGIFLQNIAKYDRALAEYKYIIENIDSTYAQAYYNIGYMYLEYSGKYDKAIKYFKKAVKFDPDAPNSWYNLGLSYERNNNKKQAVKMYKKAIEIMPGYKLAIDALKRVSK